MSKFHHFAVKANEVAKKALAELVEAEDGLRQAEAESRRYPQHHGTVDFEYQLKSTNAKATLLKAQEQMNQAKRNMVSYKKQIDAVRAELKSALESEYRVDPTGIDANALELLKSGIMRPDEYAAMMNQYQTANNPTMCRLIAKHAQAAADVLEKEGYGPGTPSYGKVQELRAIALAANDDTVGSVLGLYDVLVECFERSANNTAMISAWDELTHRAVENI